MIYLLDTCVISELAKPKPEKKVIRWVEESDEEALFLSVLTIGEIQKGIARTGDVTRRTRLQHWLDGDLRGRFAHRILPIGEDVALTWGIIQAGAESTGRPVPTIDGLLAATAITHNATLVTRNVTDVLSTGALLLNPWG